ncbi:MAG: ComEC/Rec2 family competence protein, partial [Patescibacteria group bacterium]
MLANFSRAKLFLYICLSFIIGIASASFWQGIFLIDDLRLFSSVIVCAVIIILWRLFNRKTNIAVFFLLCLLFFFLGLWRYRASLPVTSPDKIWFYNGQEVSFIGQVNQEPDVRQNSVKLTVKTRFIKTGNLLPNTEREAVFAPVAGNVLVTTKLYPRHHYGDALDIKCKLKQPEQIDDFYYDRYLAMQGIYSLCYYPSITNADSSFSLPWPTEVYAAILKLKEKLAMAMNTGLPEPENSLLQGMVLNNRGELPAELNNAFAQAGITHIIAISGMNIAIISVIIINALIIIGVSRRLALFLSAGALLIYLV